MSSLFATLTLTANALLAQQDGLNVTSNNIANANTDGYSRQRVTLTESDTVTIGHLTYGSGVKLQDIESLRNPVLQLQIEQQQQRQGALDALVDGLNPVQTIFSNSSGDVGSEMSAFFTSLSGLEAAPSSMTARQAVVTAANNLANSFRTTSSTLSQQRQNVDLSVEQTVEQINNLSGQIANLAGQINSFSKLQQGTGSLTDQRNVLIEQLSDLIDVNTIQTDGGITLTTASGVALVVGDKAVPLDTHITAAGVQNVYSQGVDITSRIQSGRLAGLLTVRDRSVPDLLNGLDALAAGFTTAINTAHAAGFDLNGQPGGNLFSASPAGNRGAAAAMTVLITDPAAIAASADGSSGDSGNVAALLNVQNQPIVSGLTPADAYSNLVFSVGSAVANGLSEQEASSLILRQLQDQRGTISGVSLDEEALNLIRYQRAYEAAARVISTISDILETTVNLGR